MVWYHIIYNVHMRARMEITTKRTCKYHQDIKAYR
nr:MAG TPA: hypothetical protein [Caudoviricetes sp.]